MTKSKGFEYRTTGAREGLTLVEVLVATMVLTVGVLSILSVYFAAGRFGQDAIGRLEAARLARGVVEYIGRQPVVNIDPGNPTDEQTFASGGAYPTSEAWSAEHAPAGLVWRCRVKRHADWPDEGGLFVLSVTVSRDDDGDGAFDPVEDRELTTLVTQIAPRL